MADNAPLFPDLPAVDGKPVHVAFDGGRLTSDAGVLLLAEVERKLGIANRLAACIEDPRAPDRVRHGLAEMIRYRALMVAAGYEDANDCDALRFDPAFKLAVGRLPETGRDLCSQPTTSRLENLPGKTALVRMMEAMIELFCDSFEAVPRRLVLDIDDTLDRVHGGQQLSLFHAHYDSRCFLPMHIYEAGTGKPVAVFLRPGKTPGGAEVAMVLRHTIMAIRRRFPRVDIIVRGDSHYARHEAMHWLERNRVAYIFGLAGNSALRDRVRPLVEHTAVERAEGEVEKVRRFAEFRYAARSWHAERRVIARIEASKMGADTRYPRLSPESRAFGIRMKGLLAFHRHQSQRHPELALRDPLLRPRPGRKPDQGAQAAPRFRPDLLPQRHRQPVPPLDPHRRLLAHTQPARAHPQSLVLA